MDLLYSRRSRTERLIAAGRVVLATSSLLAVWLDPSEPVKYAAIAYSLLVAYVVYAGLNALVVWRLTAPSPRLGLVTHVFDLVFFSLFTYFTLGPGSPFTVYYIFSLVCATVRWQWRGTAWTAAAALAVFLALGTYYAEVLRDPSFELHPFIIRGVYMAVIAVLLGYLGAHEQRMRREIALLASWPPAATDDSPGVAGELVAHAANVLRVRRAALLWLDPEEPFVRLSIWQDGELRQSREPPGLQLEAVVPELHRRAFLAAVGDEEPVVWRDSSGGVGRWRGSPLRRLDLLFGSSGRGGRGTVLGQPLAGQAIEGWLFFFGHRGMTSDDLLLADIVGATVAARLDHQYLLSQLKESAADAERVRLARDLHDGVLQSFAGIGLRLAALRRLVDEEPEEAREQLLQLQRLMVGEQRDLRFFIQELQPRLGPPAPVRLAERLAELVRRVEQAWQLRVELHLGQLDAQLPDDLERDVYNIVREALINAVRHGGASGVEVRVSLCTGTLAVDVRDNGRGFPFHGRFNGSQLAQLDAGPRSVRERVAARGGSLALETSGTGTTLTVQIPAAFGELP